MARTVDHDRRRREYLDALWQVVDDSGPQAVSVRSVADAAGRSKSNVAYYFPSRAHLLAAAVVDNLRVVEAYVADVDFTSFSVDDAVDAIMQALPTTPSARKRSGVWLLLAAEHTDDPELTAALTSLDTTLRNYITAGLGGLMQSGAVDPSCDITVEAERLHALIDGLTLQAVYDPDRLSRDHLRQVVTAHLATLAPRPSDEPSPSQNAPGHHP